MADEIKSEESQTAGDDETSTEEVVEPKEEKVEISKTELDTLRAADGKKGEEIDNLKRTIYSEDYLNFLQKKGTAQAQPVEENLEFMSQKDLHRKIMQTVDSKLRNLYLAQAAQNQEKTVIQQITDAQGKYTDYDVMRPAMKKIAERVGGNLTADDAYRLAKQEAGQPLQLRKVTTVLPKTTEKPGVASATTKKTEFSEEEAVEEAARISGLDKFLAERQK